MDRPVIAPFPERTLESLLESLLSNPFLSPREAVPARPRHAYPTRPGSQYSCCAAAT
ncbi:hypothetical protein OH687_27550 [Burkholderia anthina]|nr:hypothetical protein OH687_27550 [Burkholderia anthina]